MKIVDRKAFLALPNGTLFAKYQPCVIGEPLFKQDSIDFTSGDDFWYSGLHDQVASHSSDEMFDLLDSAEHDGASIALDLDVWSRDGLFDTDQKFAIYEAADLDAMIAKLQAARALLPETPTP